MGLAFLFIHGHTSLNMFTCLQNSIAYLITRIIGIQDAYLLHNIITLLITILSDNVWHRGHEYRSYIRSATRAWILVLFLFSHEPRSYVLESTFGCLSRTLTSNHDKWRWLSGAQKSVSSCWFLFNFFSFLLLPFWSGKYLASNFKSN